MRCHGWRTEVVWFVTCALLSSAYCVSSAAQLGATVDEPDYVSLGLSFWRTGRHTAFLYPGTMLLSSDVQTLPLALAERLRGVPFTADDLPQCLPWARAGNLLFLWLLL